MRGGHILEARKSFYFALACMIITAIPSVSAKPVETTPRDTGLACNDCLRLISQLPAQQAGGSTAFPPPAKSPNSGGLLQLLAEARHLIHTGQVSQAIEILERATVLNPRNLAVFFYRGVAFDELGDPKRAVREYAHSLNLAKSIGMDSSELRSNLGNSLVKLGYLKEAIFDYERAIEIDPSNAQAHHLLGRALLLQGRYEDALDSLRRCEELGLSGARISYAKALALAALGEKEDCLGELAPCLTNVTRLQDIALHNEASRLKEILSARVSPRD